MTINDLKKSLELCAAAYADKQPGCHCVIHTIDDQKSGIQCYLRIYQSSVWIVFRGTDTAEDLLRDLRFWKKRIPYGNYDSDIRVHSGFIEAYKSTDVRKKIHSVITDNICRIEISGHSLGAAMAALCAIDLNYNFPHLDITAVLFGAPRVGNRAFARSYDRRVFKTFRVENSKDIVTRLPPALLGYRHVGIKIRLRQGLQSIFPPLSAHDVKSYYESLMRLS